MTEPWAQAAARIVLHGTHFGRGAERIGDPLSGSLVVGGEAHSDMAVVENGIILPVSLLDLVQGLRDQEALQTVARHEGERALKEVETAEGGEFIEHEQQ